jgi:hypothetical protein
VTDQAPETPEEITNEEIYATLKQYEEAGVISFILPTEPLGEEWVLGVPDGLGGLMKLKGKDQAVGWLAGAAALAYWARERQLAADPLVRFLAGKGRGQ